MIFSITNAIKFPPFPDEIAVVLCSDTKIVNQTELLLAIDVPNPKYYFENSILTIRGN